MDRQTNQQDQNIPGGGNEMLNSPRVLYDAVIPGWSSM